MSTSYQQYNKKGVGKDWSGKNNLELSGDGSSVINLSNAIDHLVFHIFTFWSSNETRYGLHEHILEEYIDPSRLIKGSRRQAWLYHGSLYGHITAVSALVQSGADPHCRDRNGVSPVHAAAYGGHPPVLEYYRSIGVDLSTKDNGGNTIIEWASANPNDAKRDRTIKWLKYMSNKGNLGNMSGNSSEYQTSMTNNWTLLPSSEEPSQSSVEDIAWYRMYTPIINQYGNRVQIKY